MVAKAPPAKERFFYFERVDQHDYLFLETMKALHPDECRDPNQIRLRKAEFLRRFKNDGFYLVDVFDDPVPKRSRAEEERQLRAAVPLLIGRVRQLVSPDTPIVLVSVPVYRGCADGLRQAGFKVANTGPIEFPASGGQRKYREKLRSVLEDFSTS